MCVCVVGIDKRKGKKKLTREAKNKNFWQAEKTNKNFIFPTLEIKDRMLNVQQSKYAFCELQNLKRRRKEGKCR